MPNPKSMIMGALLNASLMFLIFSVVLFVTVISGHMPQNHARGYFIAVAVLGGGSVLMLTHIIWVPKLRTWVAFTRDAVRMWKTRRHHKLP